MIRTETGINTQILSLVVSHRGVRARSYSFISTFRLICTFSVQVSLVFTRYGVEEHEVLKVGDLSSLPALGHVGGLVELFRTGQRNPSVGKTHHIQKFKK